MAPVTTPAVLLRGYDYGDSSRILRFYTRDHGLVSVIAKGVRGRSGKGGTTLSNFASGDLSAYVRTHRDLHTMKDFQCVKLREGLGRDVLRFAGASAAAELVLVHAEAEPQTGVFRALETTLDALEGAVGDRVPGTVLAGLWSIIESFGFAPQLDGCVRCHETLEEKEVGRFDFAAGGLRCAACGHDTAGPRVGPGARSQITSLLAGDVPREFSHAPQHLTLVSDFIVYHVASRPLKSLTFLGGLMPDGEAAVSDG
ncbi:MAG: DNA repair protein RecO [Longimicrobiales bacterium]|nr:DNA repair protein RecO [Longimicrobiales bacterium]